MMAQTDTLERSSSEKPTAAETMNKLALIGVPTDVGAGVRGASLGPEALRIAGLATSLRELGHNVVDLGDLGGPPNPEEQPGNGCRNLREVSTWCRLLRDRIYEVAGDRMTPVVLGGDHCIAMGSIVGIAKHCSEQGRPLFVMWFDAHTDFNTPLSSPSGNVHGMPIAALCGRIDNPEFDLGVATPVVEPSRINLFGIRSVDQVEKASLVDSGMKVFDMRAIDERSTFTIMGEILEEVATAGGHLHVSLDVDFLDPSIAPGVGTTVPGGVTYREAHLCMEMIAESGLLGSLDLVELNPLLDERNKSAELLVDLTGSLFGKATLHR
ncbi:arginase [Pelagibius sp. Alg239-R121]|uniref:arginase n=1 Tax=Pelagibius sp. Alg239-R121 TaxID=2993448 RepID=UPI002AC34E18|nr:arginase [Pelagibius sp. Alg239-R121]